MYCQLLERAVHELQGEPIPERHLPSLHLGIDIKLPQSYLPDSGDRLSLYKRLAQALRTADVDRLQADTEDRFGHLPQAARNLFNMGRLRLIAEESGVRSVDLVEDKLQIRFHESPPVEPERVIQILTSEQGSLTPSGTLLLPAPPRGADRIECVEKVLQRILGKSAA